MGHGTPLKTGDADDVGVAGPFMLDAAISSSFHIATFWGLTDGGPRRATQKLKQQPRAAAPHETQIKRIATIDRSAQPAKGSAWPPATGVRKTIEDALRAAGLMK
jgi:hypothetical protein